MDEGVVLLAREWMRKAEHDLGMAKLGLDSGSKYTDGICFHCQQAAEKFLKAVLVLRGIDADRTHDLAKLLDTLAPQMPVGDSWYDEAEVLNAYAVQVRYPAGLPDPSVEEACDAFQIVHSWREVITSSNPALKGDC